MAILSTADFYANSGYTALTINSTYLYTVLANVEKIVNDYLGMSISTHTTIATGEANEFINIPGNNTDFIKTSVWQETGLTISRGSYGSGYSSQALDTLTIYEDFLPKYAESNKIQNVVEPKPLYAIKLLNGATLKDSEFLQITGTLGWYDNDYPARIKQAVYKAIKTMVEENDQTTNSKGAGYLTRDEDLTTKVGYTISTEQVKAANSLAMDLTSNPVFVKMLEHYRGYVNAKQSNH